MSRVRADELTINLASLLAEPVGSVRDFAIDRVDVELGPDLRLARPAVARFRIIRTNRGVVVDGDATALLAEECSRCLRSVQVEVASTIAEEALPTVDLATGIALDTTAEPDVARLNDRHELDLEPLVRDAIELVAPIAPVCRRDCPGLCPVCGLDLTDFPHHHDEEEIDPRLEALRRFRVDEDDENR